MLGSQVQAEKLAVGTRAIRSDRCGTVRSFAF